MDLSNLYSIFSILTCSRENSRTLWYPGINIHATNSFCQVVQECEKFMNNSRPTRQSGYLIRMKGLISLRAKAFNLPTLSCLNCVYWFWNKLIAWLAFRNNGKSWLGNKANRLKQGAHRSSILSAMDLCHFPSKYHWDSVPGGAGETHTVAPVRLCINTCLARSAFVYHADTSGKTQWWEQEESGWSFSSQTKLVTCSLLFISSGEPGDSHSKLKIQTQFRARNSRTLLGQRQSKCSLKCNWTFAPTHDELQRQLHSSFNYSNATWGNGTKSH